MPSPAMTAMEDASALLRRAHAVGDETHDFLEHRWRRLLLVPQAPALAEEVADAHQRPRARFGIAVRELAFFRRRRERGSVAFGDLLVVLAKDVGIDELRLLHDAIKAAMLPGEVEERLEPQALRVESVLCAADGLRGV